MSGGPWHQFISRMYHPNQSYHLEGHSLRLFLMDNCDDHNNDNNDKNNDKAEDGNFDNGNGKDFTLWNAC